MSLQLSAPEPLSGSHRLDDFECGEAALDDWLKRRAMANQVSAASRTFVVADQGGRICGYYAMAAGAVSHQMATAKVRRNMPDPVPVMVPGQLAVDVRSQGAHLGASLLQDAVNRTLAVSAHAGVRALRAPRSGTGQRGGAPTQVPHHPLICRKPRPRRSEDAVHAGPTQESEP